MKKKNVNERVCFICHDQIEDDKHVLLDRPLYADLYDKFIYLFKRTECYNMVAKTCFNILSRRNSFFIFLIDS
jgi:hypothetical protein